MVTFPLWSHPPFLLITSIFPITLCFCSNGLHECHVLSCQSSLPPCPCHGLLPLPQVSVWLTCVVSSTLEGWQLIFWFAPMGPGFEKYTHPVGNLQCTSNQLFLIKIWENTIDTFVLAQPPSFWRFQKHLRDWVGAQVSVVSSVLLVSSTRFWQSCFPMFKIPHCLRGPVGPSPPGHDTSSFNWVSSSVLSLGLGKRK